VGCHWHTASGWWGHWRSAMRHGACRCEAVAVQAGANSSSRPCDGTPRIGTEGLPSLSASCQAEPNAMARGRSFGGKPPSLRHHCPATVALTGVQCAVGHVSPPQRSAKPDALHAKAAKIGCAAASGQPSAQPGIGRSTSFCQSRTRRSRARTWHHAQPLGIQHAA
jgi:hypothetical protein